MISLLKQIEIVGKIFENMADGYHLDVDIVNSSLPKEEQQLSIDLTRGTKGHIKFPFSRKIFVENDSVDVVSMILKKALGFQTDFKNELTKENILQNVQYALKGKGYIDAKKESSVLAREIMDLYVRYVVPKDEYNLYITDSIVEEFGLSMPEIDAYAAKNLRNPGGCTCLKLESMLHSLGMDVEENPDKDIELYVLRHGEEHGASVILNKEFMSECVCKKDVEFAFIIPSSVHEVIMCYPVKGEDIYAQALNLKAMCERVNKDMVADGDALSDSIYVSDRKGNVFKIA